MQRKKEASMKSLTIRLSAEDIEWLNQKADIEDRTVSAVIRVMIKKERSTSNDTSPLDQDLTSDHLSDQVSP
jgi:hypothetical protein